MATSDGNRGDNTHPVSIEFKQKVPLLFNNPKSRDESNLSYAVALSSATEEKLTSVKLN